MKPIGKLPVIMAIAVIAVLLLTLPCSALEINHEASLDDSVQIYLINNTNVVFSLTLPMYENPEGLHTAVYSAPPNGISDTFAVMNTFDFYVYAALRIMPNALLQIGPDKFDIFLDVQKGNTGFNYAMVPKQYEFNNHGWMSSPDSHTDVTKMQVIDNDTFIRYFQPYSGGLTLTFDLRHKDSPDHPFLVHYSKGARVSTLIITLSPFNPAFDNSMTGLNTPNQSIRK